MTLAAPAISEEKALTLLASVYAEAKSGATIIGHKRGSINQVFQIGFREEQLALRVRHNEIGFQYEKGICKEILVALLTAEYQENNDIYLDGRLGAVWKQLLGKRSNERIHFPCGADIFHYDFTGRIYPGPWAVFEWAGDDVGSAFNADKAFQLGQIVAQIHNMKFGNAYRDLHRHHIGGVNILSEWEEEILRRNRPTASVIVPEQVLAPKLRSLRAAAKYRPLTFVLCHNDLHCLNLTEKAGRLRILDWDNAQIAPAELDFVKMAHWSRLNGEGYFEPDPAIFSSFCEGYGVSPAELRSSSVFKLAELLWLFRGFEFALGMTEPVKPPFWPAAQYGDLILQRLTAP